MVDAILTRPTIGASSNPAVRLGMIGIAFADKGGVVFEVHGELSSWLKVGVCVSDSSTALLGMDEALEELRMYPDQRLSLPNICLDQFSQHNFYTINVQWDNQESQYVITTTKLEAYKGSELDGLREQRSQQYLQERLAEERQHFRTQYEQSPHLALCYNNRAVMIAASNKTREIFLGNSPVTSNLHELLSSGTIWDAVWGGNPPKNHLIKAVNLEGNVRQLELTGCLVTPPGMLTEEVYYSLIDVTERNQTRLAMREHSQMLETAGTQLRESNKQLSRFAARAAHDLLSPLRRIGMFTQILREEFSGPQSESLSFALNAVETSAQRGQQLVDDVMHLTQMANARPQLTLVCPSTVLREIAQDSDVQLEQAQGSIHYMGDHCKILGDEKLLRTIYRNLLSNAIKFRDNERELRIVHQVTDTGTGRTRIEFRDNGIGFDTDKAATVFEPFTRLVGEDEYVGTGLGLSIVKEAANAMDAQLTATSQIAKGTSIALIARSEPAAFKRI